MSEQQKGEDKLLIRLPLGMADRLKAQAQRHSRSVNGEVTWALLQYLESQEKEQRDYAQDV